MKNRVQLKFGMSGLGKEALPISSACVWFLIVISMHQELQELHYCKDGKNCHNCQFRWAKGDPWCLLLPNQASSDGRNWRIGEHVLLELAIEAQGNCGRMERKPFH